MKNAFCFFVDEAGDTTLFDKKGSIIVGETGNSKVFMVGVAMVSDPRNVRIELNNLRQSLLKDPYFSGVPSMQPEAQKTCLYFHAKDDLPEVNEKLLGLDGSPTQVVKIFTPPPRKGAQKLEGEPKEVVEKLVELLKGEI